MVNQQTFQISYDWNSKNAHAPYFTRILFQRLLGNFRQFNWNHLWNSSFSCFFFFHFSYFSCWQILDDSVWVVDSAICSDINKREFQTKNSFQKECQPFPFFFFSITFLDSRQSFYWWNWYKESMSTSCNNIGI